MASSFHHLVPQNTPIATTRNSHYHSQNASNQDLQIQAPTPTPSDISSIQTTSRAPCSAVSMSASSRISGINGTGGEKDTFLAPGQVLKQTSWLAYDVVPPLQGGISNGSFGHLEGLVGGGQSSHNSLSPSVTMQEYSQCPSARVHGKKRPRSTSTQSSDYDILGIIRNSPSALFPCVGSRGSSINTSPQPGHQLGCVSHLMARSTGISPMMSDRKYYQQQMNHMENLEENNLSMHYAMGQLERTDNANINNMGMINSNNMIVQNSNPQEMYQNEFNYYHQQRKLEHPGEQQQPLPPYNNGGGISLNMNLQVNLQQQQAPYPQNHNYNIPTMAVDGHPVVPLDNQHHNHMPPPPPYPSSFDTVSSQNNSTLTTGTETDVKPDLQDVEKENVKHECCWIDCNTVFSEQSELVTHIEKQHIDQRRGDDFTCYWAGCQRRQKPFNARYKLLIHMRVHSGERPNKCTVCMQTIFVYMCVNIYIR